MQRKVVSRSVLPSDSLSDGVERYERETEVVVVVASGWKRAPSQVKPVSSSLSLSLFARGKKRRILFQSHSSVAWRGLRPPPFYLFFFFDIPGRRDRRGKKGVEEALLLLPDCCLLLFHILLSTISSSFSSYILFLLFCRYPSVVASLLLLPFCM